MLKAKVDTDIWLVQQHHHAEVSGYLAAHWGGNSGFTSPGAYPGATDPDRWRDEVVLGIAEHDNGWWETEAMPRFSSRDGLPIGVGEADTPTEENEFAEWRAGGFDRWRTGIERIAESHPYGALLISLHAYWLYAVKFPDLMPRDADHLRHFVFGDPDVAAGLVGDPTRTRAFLEEQLSVQKELTRRLADNPILAQAIQPEHLNAHFRLLQLMDSLSLFLSLNDLEPHELPEVPRSSWADRTTITWSHRDARTIELDPYPFAIDPLPVHLPVRTVKADPLQRPAQNRDGLLALHGSPLTHIPFTLVSRA